MDIAIFIAQDNPTRALSFVDDLEDRCALLASAPGSPELGAGIYTLPHGRSLIFYREAGTALRVERILHSGPANRSSTAPYLAPQDVDEVDRLLLLIKQQPEY